MKCKQCGVEVQKVVSREFCSVKCRVAFNAIPKICPICKSTFKAKRSIQKYCSEGCKNKNWSNMGIAGAKKSYTYEARSKISQRMWNTQRDKILKKRDTKEARMRISQSSRERFQDLEFIKKHSESVKKAMTEEHKARLSEAAVKSMKNRYNRVTIPNLIIVDLLDRLQIHNKKEFHLLHPELNKYKSYDICLPDNKILIEIMGDYHHCNPLFYDNKSEYQAGNVENDLLKKELVEKYYKEYTLIYLWESDVMFNIKKCEDIILKACSKEQHIAYPCIELKDYEIKEIEDKAIVIQFLKKYHYIKSKNLPIKQAYGLHVNGSLIGIGVFGYSANPQAVSVIKGSALELIRFCLVGGLPKNTASYFLSRIVQLIKIKIPDLAGLISYADTSLHLGTIYRATNWTELGEVQGSYYYETEQGETLARHKIFKHCQALGISEREYIQRLNLKRVDTSTKLKFIYLF